MNSFSSFHEAFHYLIDQMKINGKKAVGPSSSSSIGSDFGKKTRDTLELLCTTIEITNPRDRLLPESCRPLNYGFAFAHYIWAITPSSNPQQIMAYNPRGNSFLNEKGQLICGVSERIIGSNQVSPLQNIIEMLKKDPNTRRAYLPFVYPNDLKEVPKDFSCFGAIHFLQRDGKLDCITNMRAQSLIGVMPYDVILATLLHETVANELNLELGSYYHQCNNLHCYIDENSHIDAINNCGNPSIPMDIMPKINPLNYPELLLQESSLRKDKKVADNFDDKINNSYWKNIFSIMEDTLNWEKNNQL